jgi:tetratricopeptide (TPR) repeat protein
MSNGSSNAARSTQQSDVSSTNEIVHRRVQNVLLVWLDNNIDNNSDDCQNTITQLRSVMNEINTFTDGEQCIQFIEKTTDNKMCMLISGALGQTIVPHVHGMSQMDSIFIFCGNQKLHQEWIRDWSKIKGVFTEINPICAALKVASKQCEQDAMSISFVSTNDGASSKNLNHLDPSFMYTQLLKKILLSIQFEGKHFNEFIEHCRKQFTGNAHELDNINMLEKDYRNKTPIWWYTYECFLYPMLNLGLRTMNVDIIIKMGFFINDLHSHIEQLHSEQFGGHFDEQTLTLFRGQGLTISSFEQMKKDLGGLMSFNNFLSTSKKRAVSMKFLENILNKPDSVRVLFVMKIDLTQSRTPFASINDVGCFGDEEDEVLFSMHSVFRICDIQPISEKTRLFQVNLTLTSDNDEDLCQLTDLIEKETLIGQKGWYQLGAVLIKMGQNKKAEEVFEILLEQTDQESKRQHLYHRLAWAKEGQGKYREAIEFYEKAVEIKKKTLAPNDPSLAMSYNNIGNVHQNMSDYPEALSSYEKALAIQQQSLSPNHPDLAKCYNNIGLIHLKMRDYAKALVSIEKALGIFQQSLSLNHPDIASSYNNIGLVYQHMRDYPKALSPSEKALTIQQQSLPSDHPNLAVSSNNIGIIYFNMGDYAKALDFIGKALAIIQQQTVPSNYMDLGESNRFMGAAYHRVGDYPKAIASYEEALAIKQQSLSSNHPHLIVLYSTIGWVYENMGDYLKALSCCEKALAIPRETLAADHLALGESYTLAGWVCDKIGDYPKALLYHEKALAIYQQPLPPNHPNLGNCYNNIGLVYMHMVDYPKSLSNHEKGLTIRQLSLGADDPNLAESVNNIGLVYMNMKDYSKALWYLEKALAIRQKIPRSNDPDLGESYHNIGLVYENTKDYVKALSYLEKGLSIRQQSLPSNHPDLAMSYGQIGHLYLSMEEYFKALAFYQDAVNIAQQFLPSDHPHRQWYINNLDDLRKTLLVTYF